MKRSLPVKIPFNFHDVFKKSDIESQFVLVLSHIHSNVSLTFDYMTKFTQGEASHPDAYIYFLATNLSHLREAIKRINDWIKLNELQGLIERSDVTEILDSIKMSDEEFKKSVVGKYLKPLRDLIFHYHSPNETKFLDEIIEGVEFNNHEIEVLEDGTDFGTIRMSYSKSIISGILTLGMSHEDELREKFKDIEPLIVNVNNFCCAVIVQFLIEKGVTIPD